jgi:CRISPR/Cas system Type II protein with McrA/HNH and RuvC-like nuclease domain
MTRRKVSGTAHEEKIQTSRQVAVLGKNGDCVVEQENYKRVELGDKINLKKLENLFDVKRNWKLKQALEERLREYGDDGEKAFKEPFFMPGKKQGTLGARVKSVLIKSGDKSGIQVRGRGPKGFGFAPNGSMIRVDVFREVTGRTSKFHLVPVYAWHFSRAYLPEPEASVSGHINSGASSEPHFQFMFSLHPNEYIEVVDAKDRKASGYFITFDSSDGRIKWAPHDRAGKGNEDGQVKEKEERVATVTAKSIRKFEVDILGNRREVLPGKEPRRGLENRRSRKQGLRPV